MSTNRSRPPGVIIPEVPYADMNEAADWLCRAFGFKKRLQIGNHRFQLSFGDSSVIAIEGNDSNPSCSVWVGVDNVDHCYEQAKAMGAETIREPADYPFGAILVDENNQVLLEAENTVVTGQDCTGHAETNLMRLASQQFSPEKLALCTLYTSTEPCVMCAGAIHWGNMRRVVYALSEVGLYEIAGASPDNLLLPCREVFARSGRSVEVIGPATELDVEARAVHDGFWIKK